MRLTEISYGSALPVEGYGPGFFRVGGHVLRGACLVTPWDAGPWGGLEDTATPLAMAGRIDVLLLGMGAEIAHPPRAFREALEAEGIGVEVMSSPAACRTYNVLLGEGRRIAAALLPVGGP
ncbi:Mth938-like domain-containing protein [Rhodobacteraceae bacterium HSP-20]|uniref:Mth938-like domain-containing protein n=1 Tax=Paragemmobacter amnigenus TaxID=2852097 RepID=A0ABS6J7K2_9RHOB|nr:Mth938-like domain-containing protein [Rhodobacter amnigenus]MBU9699487.1 Mth938-like domain-containing protein [Rhodobacter amnigenus]MBV4390714.1 Mth938-like domain-containing protein [Rhodobacter amnigenus]